MFERKNQELKALNRAHLDGRAQDDMAWLDLRGNVPLREKGRSEGWMASFEKHPMLWSVIVLLAGSGIFFLVTRFLL